jgi:uncharacterized protein with HEPN domain
MPSRNWQFRIRDILKAIDKIERYTRDMEFDAWLQDDKTIDAVIRNVEVIGEASSHLPDEVLEQYKDIPWRLMRGIRNILAHEYFGVDLEIIWTTVKEDLPTLKSKLTD